MHSTHVSRYAFRKMGPAEMALWDRRRKHPVRFVAMFVLIGLAVALLCAVAFSAFQPGFGKGLGHFFGAVLMQAICGSVCWGTLLLMIGIIFYSSGVSKYKQAWASGTRPLGWEYSEEQKPSEE